MNANNMFGIVIGVVVGVLLLSTTVLPAISNAQNNNVTTFTNVGNGTYYEVDPTEDVTLNIVWEAWTLNGEPYDTALLSTNPIFTTDTCRASLNGRFLQLFDSTGLRTVNANIQATMFTVEYDNSADTLVVTQYTDLTPTTVANTYSYTATHLMLYNIAGEYTAFTSDGQDPPGDYYVNSLDQVVAGGAYTSGDLDTSYFAQGETVTVGVASYTASASATTTEVLKDVIKGSTYTVTVTDGNDSESFTPYTIYVPKEVHGHTDLETSTNTMIGFIPILIVIGLIVGIVGVAFSRRD